MRILVVGSGGRKYVNNQYKFRRCLLIILCLIPICLRAEEAKTDLKLIKTMEFIASPGEYVGNTCPEVKLIMQKDIYSMGDPLVFTLSNNFPESIFVLGGLNTQSKQEIDYKVEKMEGRAWRLLNYGSEYKNGGTAWISGGLIEIKPGSSLILESGFPFLSPGRYRLQYAVRIHCNEAIKKYGMELKGFNGEPLCKTRFDLVSDEFTVEGIPGVSVATDKNVYIQGQVIKITLNNAGKKSLSFLSDPSCIEIYQDGKWQNLYSLLEYKWRSQPMVWGVFDELAPNQSKEWFWEQKMWKQPAAETDFILAPKGKYRVALSVQADYFRDIKYSPEFNIE